jgi:hypothetical protein
MCPNPLEQDGFGWVGSQKYELEDARTIAEVQAIL